MSEQKTAHTPGPWGDDGINRVTSLADGYPNDGWVICDCDGPDSEANARLIAAAPDLLAELWRALEALEAIGDLPSMQSSIRAALAKAEGRSNV